MSRLRTTTVVVSAICIIVAGLVAVTYALFHGYFDRGRFEIKESQWSPSGQVAMVAKRSDHQALNSDEYDVLIGDHIFDASELRRAYYSDRPVFSTSNDCLSVSWNGPRNLEVTCRDAVMTAGEINYQRHQDGNIAIAYVNIPDVTTGSPTSNKK